MNKDELLNQIRELFAQMESEYETVAGTYNFSCEGCRENCCTIGFQHHTMLEFELLKMGFESLSEEEREEICEKSVMSLKEKDAGRNPKCPLLLNDRCRLYEFRPMICRLHGLPHILLNPAKGTFMGDGCMPFQRKFQQPYEATIDRTPFYREFAALEKLAREIPEFSIKPKARSVPEMILEMQVT